VLYSWTQPRITASALELELEHPSFGCSRYEAMLALEGVRVSSITIQKILNGRQRGAIGSSPLATVWARVTSAGWRWRRSTPSRPSN
jgi:hypothetical protein